MAFGLKHWIGAVAVGAVVVAIWQLPPEHFGEVTRPAPAAVELRHDELSSEFRVTARTLRRVRWADSLSALAIGTARDGVAFAMPPSEAVGTDLPVQLEEKVRTARAEFGDQGTGVVFGYFHQAHEHGRTPDMPWSSLQRTETYVGTRDGVDYCLQVRVRRTSSANAVLAEIAGVSSTPPVSDVMGPCRFYLRHGMPGASIEAWLEGGGVAFAIEDGDKPEPSDETLATLKRNRAFGNGRLGPRARPIIVDHCLAGDASACRSIFLDPSLALRAYERDIDLAQRSPALSVDARIGRGEFTRDGAYLLSDLEADFGREAFGAFWRSELPFEAAFEAAFDVTVETWVTDWIRRVDDPTQVSPALSRSASSGTILAVAIFVGLAFMRTRRRQVV